MTKKLALTFTGLFALTLATTVRAGVLKITPGLWKTTATSTNSTQTVRPRTATGCITQKEIDDFATNISQPKAAPGQKCKRTEFNETAATMDFKYECVGQIKFTEQGSFKFSSPTSYVGTMIITGDVGGGQTSQTFSTIEGTRVGDCPAKAGATH
jgi:hypothetical protein